MSFVPLIEVERALLAKRMRQLSCPYSGESTHSRLRGAPVYDRFEDEPRFRNIWYRIDATTAVGAIVVKEGKVVDQAPYFNFMHGWDLREVMAWVRRDPTRTIQPMDHKHAMAGPGIQPK